MRLNTFPSAAAAAVCGALALLIAGPALASDGPPAESAPAATGSLETIGGLGETLMLGSRIGTEARAKTPDTVEMQELQRRLRAASGRLQRSVKAGASADADVQAQLKKLDDDATALLKAVAAEDAAGVTAGVAAMVADQRALLGSVPKLLAP
ncbi:hypothetical protein [Streptomyces morookaense]|uniref:Uncharacterized protein n=1 Tax=Streptomyces morookaense TaxID=1970 RepID=A0A7Y7B261_STRMO|nr:hypothetical protein [Streptomyces morookaense]NVK77661.1 hypothetical protein [Streptomyces morookaense]GHF05495.1 hypothetical protein GCM10010359_03080 [Streptomyces morookaense]